MLEQVARVLFWLGIGEVAARTGLIPFPAPVTGLMLLYSELAIRGKLPNDLGTLADRILQLLGMLFVPAGVGVIAHLDILKSEALPILAGVIGGTAITLFVKGLVASRFGKLSAAAKENEPVRLEEVARNVSL